jgi:hypothetical protein
MNAESESPKSENLERLWRITITLGVPTSVPMPPGGGLPSQLQFQSRIDEQSRQYGDIAIAIRKVPSPGIVPSGLQSDPRVEWMHLVADVPAADSSSAIVNLSVIVEPMLDVVSFEMGTALGLAHTEVLDVTPPLVPGEQRELMIFGASPFDKNARSIDMQTIQGLLKGRLPDSTVLPDSRVAAVLRWFVKSLETVVLHDQFIFLWIGLEILCDESDTRVEVPYAGPCGHAIPTCPRCGRATTKMVRGATLRSFLQGLQVSDNDATALWKMRQLMHGAIPFDSEKLEQLPALVQVLRATVAGGLKAKMGWDEGAPPLVAAAGLSIHPAVAVGGTRAIEHGDAEPLVPRLIPES